MIGKLFRIGYCNTVCKTDNDRERERKKGGSL